MEQIHVIPGTAEQRLLDLSLHARYVSLAEIDDDERDFSGLQVVDGATSGLSDPAFGSHVSEQIDALRITSALIGSRSSLNLWLR